MTLQLHKVDLETLIQSTGKRKEGTYTTQELEAGGPCSPQEPHNQTQSVHPRSAGLFFPNIHIEGGPIVQKIKFNPQQSEAISHKEGPMILLCVAGSGKTRVLTERVIHLIEQGFDPTRLLAITFAKKAVMEIQSRLKKRLDGSGDKALVCTFHSLGYRILMAENSSCTGFRLVQDLEQLSLLRQAMQNIGMEEDPALIMSKVSLAKNDLISPADLEGSGKHEDKKIAEVYSYYELLKRRKRLLDFDDLLYLPYQLFRTHGDTLERCQNRFQQILIDEFQDSSRVMVELVKMLSEPHRNIWLAGDDDQSIHGFRGARSDIFVSFGKEYGAGAKTITMSYNYRSTKNIIRAANNLISHNNIRVAKQMVTENEDGEEVEILEGDTEIAEAEIIAKKVLELADCGYRFDEIAILARLHRLMPLIEGALIKEKIPYSSLGEFLHERQDMKTAVAAIQYLLKGGPGEALDLEFLNGVREDLYPHHEEINLRAAFEIASTYTMIKGEGKFIDEEAKILKRTYLDALEYLLSAHQELSSFLAHIEEAKKINQSSPRGKVNIMTIHQAKGLEFKCVIVPGLNEGILPHVNSLEQMIMDLEEERRLMYVAMTRAMERLIITHRKRQMGQPITVASRFLKELTGRDSYRWRQSYVVIESGSPCSRRSSASDWQL
jgi:DNA helicase-2/ATP-dependent DNA helicase PcrA